MFSLVGGVANLVVIGLVCSCKPSGIALWLGITLFVLGLLLAFRRLSVKRHLSLDRDALMLPNGFLEVRTVRILYSEIERVWKYDCP